MGVNNFSAIVILGILNALIANTLEIDLAEGAKVAEK